MNISNDFIYSNFQDLLSITKIGAWEWNLITNKVIFSDTSAELIGYKEYELEQSIFMVKNIIYPDDMQLAADAVKKHIYGEVPLYEAELRLVCKDGSLIWVHNKGKIVEYDEKGRPIKIVGIVQDITDAKKTEEKLKRNQETLDIAANAASLGTWDLDIENNSITYNDVYMNMIGNLNDLNTHNLDGWKETYHKDDLPRVNEAFFNYLNGKNDKFECETRIRHKDGHYIWARVFGKIVEKNLAGKPKRIIGGFLGIDEIKKSQQRLRLAYDELHANKGILEEEIRKRTHTLLEQKNMLLMVNNIAQVLLTYESDRDFDGLINECLKQIGELVNKNRVYIWGNMYNSEGLLCCAQIYEWVRGAEPQQGNPNLEEVPYDNNLPTFKSMFTQGKCLNRLVKDLSQGEIDILAPQGIKSILVAPINIKGENWGFIGVDNCVDEKLFTDIEENMLSISGFLLASAYQKVETEAKMREMEERTTIMLNATPLCCSLWDEDFHNIACNDEAIRLFGLPSHDAYLERFFDLSPKYQPNGRLSFAMGIENIKKAFDEGYYKFEWVHQKLDGELIPAEITLVRIKYKGEYVVAGYTRDLREQKAMLAEIHKVEKELRKARDEAMFSSKAKSNFLANMSHEIRTPMNAISGLAEIILRESKGRATADYALGIKNACGNLLNIINDILDISKIESGKLEIIESEYRLSSLINDVINIARLRIDDKPIMFLANIDSRLPEILFGDEIRLKQIIINLLSNAAKFTHKGHISLDITGEVLGGIVNIKFKVSDTGIGIKKEDLGLLFVEFERVNTTKNRNIEGTGLGLAISKCLCEMMGGRIEVESKYGKGSVFTVMVPQKINDYIPIAEINENKTVIVYEPRELYLSSLVKTLDDLGIDKTVCQNQSELCEWIASKKYDYIFVSSMYVSKVRNVLITNKIVSKIVMLSNLGETETFPDVLSVFMPITCLQIANILNDSLSVTENESKILGFIAPDAKILIVDDNTVNLNVAIGLMKPYEFEIDTAVNGLEAIDRVKNNKYDIVFMDHMMPIMDGIDATSAIRKLKGDYYSKLPIIALTANAIVGTKEMFLKEGMNDFLAKPIEINKLNNVLSKWISEDKKHKVERVSEESSDQPEVRIKGLNTVAGIESVGGNLENYLHILSIYYSDGLKKHNFLHKYVKQKEFPMFRTEIHALKSSSATIGAKHLAKMAERLEEATERNDMSYIETKIEVFLAELSTLLDNIAPFINSNIDMQNNDDKIKDIGNLTNLTNELTELSEALDMANITKIENILEKISSYEWNEGINLEITNINDSITYFNYDEASISVKKLMEVIQ